jgi:hypothetical protein
VPDLDLPALRAIAEKAMGNWSYAEWQASLPEPGQEEAWLHIATFNPPMVIALLDEIDRLKKEIDWQLEQRLLQAAASHQLLDKNDALRARIEELEKELGQWIAVAGIGLPK